MSCRIRMMGRKGSKACKAIIEETGIKRYVGRKHPTDVLVNYGLAGRRLREFYRRFPSARSIPTINRDIGFSKLTVINRVKNNGILVPESKLTLKRDDRLSDWIEKRFSSQGGRGICKARGRRRMDTKYYQKFIGNRKYELRVHSFQWFNKSDWNVQKRLGNHNEIAWNFENGGHFCSVFDTQYGVFDEAIEATSRVLDVLGMSFGAADFIVDNGNRLYFIEINSCPGFQELSKGIYVSAFRKLSNLSKKRIMNYTRG